MLYKTVFDHRSLDADKALAYGFKRSKGGYTYSTSLMQGMFVLTVRVNGGDQVAIQVIDSATGEEYVLVQVHSASGEFVGQIREECAAALEKIAEQCFSKNIFKSEYAKNIIHYVKDKYKTEPEYLWEKFPSNAVFREDARGKWYAALLTVAAQSLGRREDGEMEIIDLKCPPERVASLVDGVRYLPGFHMNKKHWFTICLDGSVPIEQIYAHIDESYATVKKSPQ